MTLGKLIRRMADIMQDSETADRHVYFEFCYAFPLLSIGSSRCYYERPAIDWDVRRRRGDNKNEAPTLRDLHAALVKCVGTTIEGYKGGTYTIREELPLHVDGYGECTSTVISGIRADYHIFLETERD